VKKNKMRNRNCTTTILEQTCN